MAAGVVAAIATLVIRAQRWVRLLAPVGDAPLAVAVSSTAIGFASGVVLPLRLGELVRPALLARRTGVGLGPALASVLVERLLDVLFVVLSFLALSAVAPLPETVRAGARGLAIAAVLGFVALVLAQRHRGIAERWLARVVPERARPVHRLIGGLLDGCAALGDGRTLARVCALSAVLWVVTALVYACAIRALAIHAPAIPAALASMVIVAAFVFLPQAPGLVGTWQAGCVVALGLFDVPHDLAVGYSFLTWLTAILVQVGLGGIFLAREDLSWHDLVARPSGAPPRT